MTFVAITTAIDHQEVTFTADSALVEEDVHHSIADQHLLGDSYDHSVERCYGPPGRRMANIVGTIQKIIVGHDFLITGIGCAAVPYLWQIALARNPYVCYFDQAIEFAATGMRSALNAVGEIPSSHLFFAGWSKARQRAEVYRYTHPDYEPVLLNEGHVLHPPPADCYLERDEDYGTFIAHWSEGLRPTGAPAFHRHVFGFVDRAWREGRFRIPIAFAGPVQSAVVNAAGTRLLDVGHQAEAVAA